MRIRLTRKLAHRMDGVDVSGQDEGETFDVPDKGAALLIAEGWAEPASTPPRESADDRPRRHTGRVT